MEGGEDNATNQLRHTVHRLHPALADVLENLRDTSPGQALTDRVIEAGTTLPRSVDIDRRAALTAHRWFLERTSGDGLPLTAAGYLKPADVRAAAAVLPWMDGWTRSMTREIDVHPVHDFREHMQETGLLRKDKGTLRSSRLGRSLLTDDDALWQHLVDGLVLGGEPLDTDTSVVVLVHAATTEGRLDFTAIASALSALGWEHGSGDAVREADVYPVWFHLSEVLDNIGEPVGGDAFGRALSPVARALARDALMHEMSDADSPQ